MSCLVSRNQRPWCQEGQASVEAAVLLPTLMLVFALLLQPACMGYTRSVMQSAAAETARAALTDTDGNFDDCVAFAKRRLAAVPEVSIFHVGGADDWQVQVDRQDSGKKVHVDIRGHVRPLPLMGVLASTFSESDGTGVVMDVQVDEELRADWVGGSYDSWQEIWG